MSEGEIEIPDFEIPFDSDEIDGYSHEEDDDPEDIKNKLAVQEDNSVLNTKCLESDRDTALKAECLRRQLVIKLTRISMKRIVLNANNELGNVSSKYSKPPKRSNKNMSNDEEQSNSQSSKTPSQNRRHKSLNNILKENRQMVRKRRKQDFTMDDLNDEEETEGVDEFKSTAKPTENRNRPPKRRSTRNIQYKVRGRNFTLYTYSQL